MRRLLLVLIAGSVLVPATTASAAAACGPPAWEVVPTPNVGTGGNDLRGVTAISPTDAWAVGSGWDDAEAHSTALITHWDGTDWSLAESPAVGDSSLLLGVHGIATGDVWAVGTFSTSEGMIGRALIEHWTGEAWEVVDAPARAPEPEVTTVLTDVFALAADDAWAVGRWSAVPDAPFSPLIERWDGDGWAVVAAPEFDGWTGLNAVSATGPDDVWLVGDTEVWVEEESALVQRGLILHWNGDGFTQYDAPFNRRHPLNPFTLEDVVAISPTDAWVVGQVTRATGKVRTISLHWDGVEWTRMPLPQPSSEAQLLGGAAALSSTEVWAVGLFLHVASNEYRTLVYRWNGERWRTMSSANRRTGGELYEVAAVEGFQVAVGAAWSNRLEAYRTLGLHRCVG